MYSFICLKKWILFFVDTQWDGETDKIYVKYDLFDILGGSTVNPILQDEVNETLTKLVQTNLRRNNIICGL